MHLFNYNPYSIVNERPIAKIDAGCKPVALAATADLAVTSLLRRGSDENPDHDAPISTWWS